MQRRARRRLGGIMGGVALTALLAWPIAAMSPAHAQQDTWTTPLATKLGVKLTHNLDSSGPDAWDPKAHPLVFISTEGPGYGGLLSGVKNPGVTIINAETKKVVTSASYDVMKEFGFKSVFEPHGVGVSDDGKWIYLPTGEGSFETVGGGALLVINARTLKIDKVLRTSGQPHHAKTFQNAEGKALSYFYGWNQPLVVLDPANDNRVVGGLPFDEQGLPGYLYFASPDGTEIFAGGRDPNMAKLHDSVVIRISTKTWKPLGRIQLPDNTPVWTSFTADGNIAYIPGGHSSQVFKYDRSAGRVVANSRAGVEGPYGVHLNWKDEELYTVGKGEGSHNRGKVLGLISTKLMEKTDRPMDQFTTNCIRGDHGTLHPDPDANELWITCNSSFEIVVFDLDEKKVSARIQMPNGGSTHSGSFVKYDGWKGEVVSDQNGLQNSALKEKRRILGLSGDRPAAVQGGRS